MWKVTGYPMLAIFHKHGCLSGDLEGSPPPPSHNPLSPFQSSSTWWQSTHLFLLHCLLLAFPRPLLHSQPSTPISQQADSIIGVLSRLVNHPPCLPALHGLWPWPGHLGHQGALPMLAWILQQSSFAFLAWVSCVGRDIHGVINWLEKRKLGKREGC